MAKTTGLSISLYSGLANGIRLLSGPITLLLIAKNLNSEQIGFYYTFFSLVAMQQLAELGLGHTLRQFIAHAYELENGTWISESKVKIKGYVSFGFKWFAAVALFLILVVAPAGWCYYSDYTGTVNWLSPWLMLIGVSALVTSLIPIQILLDATQNQKRVYQAQSVSALVNSVAIWVLISLGAGLYTIPLALIASHTVFYVLISPHMRLFYQALIDIKVSANLTSIFKELWPLLSRVSIVWAVGFLFWNGFNLISFKIYDADFAGKVIFTIALARAGFGLAESFFSAQITVISYKISQGHIQQAQQYAKKYQLIALLILVLGYTAFCILTPLWPSFFLVQKTVDLEYSISIFLFFITVLWLVTQNNFIRCFKAEPFVWISIFQGIMVPLTFFLSNAYGVNGYLYPCILIMVISIIASRIISQKFLANRSFTSVRN
ncbi:MULTISPECIES: hypothetical protein [Enterobacteriaceae]|uniref:hypothetical protein n=1 Tax=Enterobacteriaceae TaxID=543 RepID=UPI001822749F|nr:MULTISPECIES: hypothetical protein [Enterobacteriaceae]EFE9206406.1 hypothetical protein [Escherichia coli]EFN0013296.1 hypothetical protein [Escherichia coli]MDE4694459.1 hypothetical protein [Klebsiella pneumoniae]MDV0978060.1 hypothetical protein [Klebsiella pneumoniae]HBR1905837.1 hypothetical protein [Klebsiella pneumoniae]